MGKTIKDRQDFDSKDQYFKKKKIKKQSKEKRIEEKIKESNDSNT